MGLNCNDQSIRWTLYFRFSLSSQNHQFCNLVERKKNNKTNDLKITFIKWHVITFIEWHVIQPISGFVNEFIFHFPLFQRMKWFFRKFYLKWFFINLNLFMIRDFFPRTELDMLDWKQKMICYFRKRYFIFTASLWNFIQSIDESDVKIDDFLRAFSFRNTDNSLSVVGTKYYVHIFHSFCRFLSSRGIVAQSQTKVSIRVSSTAKKNHSSNNDCQ